MNSEQGRLHGKYVPILADGQVKLYLPLERYCEIEGMKASGYNVDDKLQHLVATVRIIKDTEERREESEQRKRKFIEESLGDFSREVGSISIICPYCLGKINHKCEGHQGDILCGRYDLVTPECDGKASYTIDRANLVMGIPEVERYSCPVKGAQLDLAIYELKYLKEEMEWRSREIHRSIMGETSCDGELSKVFPIRISVRRTSRNFKEFVYSLMEKDAVDWLNTLILDDLTSLLERVRPSR